MFFFVTTYIPILMQIFSLIFGFMRNKKVKLLSRYGTEAHNDTGTTKQKLQYAEDSDTDDEATSQTMSDTTHKSDNSWFDPPIENYRFYYQGADKNAVNERESRKGLFLRVRNTRNLDSDSDRNMSLGVRNLYGSTMSRDLGTVRDDNCSMRTDDRNGRSLDRNV